MENEIDQLTHKIIGCAMRVHTTLGNGFQTCLPKGSAACRQEVIYQRALAVELAFQQLSLEREKEMPIFYRSEQIGTRRVDFFIEEKVMVELKAVEKLEGVHKAQAINYLEAYSMADGLLINFGNMSLEFKRVYTKKLVSKEEFKFRKSE